jgi:ATP-binding cassette subfamily B protein
VELSIGQWQKMALARAFLRQTPLIVLDEPTAALDPRAEAAVFDQFHELARGRTAIFISHRLSTVRHADRILVMVNGQIAESGAHEELLDRAGVYATLFETQAKHYR